MKSLASKLAALGAGALAMYYLDPQLGAQRRGAFADLLRSGVRRQSGPQALRGRSAGRAFDRPARTDPQADAQLRSTISERLGRLVSRPQAIQVSVEDGVVRLSGDVLAKERDGLLLQLREIPGVQKLVNAMTAHESPAAMSGAGTATTPGKQAA